MAQYDLEKVDKNMVLRVAGDEPDVGFFSVTDENTLIYGAQDPEHFYKFNPEDMAWLDEHLNVVHWFAMQCAGIQIHFATDSKKIRISGETGPVQADSGNLSPAAQRGFDLYCYNEQSGGYDYVGYGRGANDEAKFSAKIVEFPTAQKRYFILNLPLYSYVRNLEIGICTDAHLYRETKYETEDQILFYGTSITQGASASRPGLAPVNQISRHFKMPITDLGFSGNAYGEIDLYRLMTHFPRVRCVILDHEANAGPGGVQKTLEEGIALLRQAMPTTPIIICSRTPQLVDFTADSGWASNRDAHRAWLRRRVARYNKEGDSNIYFFDGTKSWGKDWSDCLMDVGHPNDLGFLRWTTAMKRLLTSILKK